MREQLNRYEGKKPLTMGHALGVAAVAVVAAIIAFWVLHFIAGVIFFFVKLAVVVALIGGVLWLISRFRR